MTANAQAISQEVIDKANELPEGKIRTSSGEIINRADAVFGLVKHPKDKRVEVAADGTMYVRDRHGSLRRITPKKGGRKK